MSVDVIFPALIFAVGVYCIINALRLAFAGDSDASIACYIIGVAFVIGGPVLMVLLVATHL